MWNGLILHWPRLIAPVALCWAGVGLFDQSRSAKNDRRRISGNIAQSRRRRMQFLCGMCVSSRQVLTLFSDPNQNPSARVAERKDFFAYLLWGGVPSWTFDGRPSFCHSVGSSLVVQKNSSRSSSATTDRDHFRGADFQGFAKTTGSSTMSS